MEKSMSKVKRMQYKDGEYALSVSEIQLLISKCTGMRDRLIIESLYYLALRRNEVCELLIENIDFSRGRITVVGKFGKISPIPVGALYPDFLTNLKLFVSAKKSGYVFVSNRGGKLEKSRINQILVRLGDNANLKNPNPNKKHINPHMLRHSQARRLKSERYSVEFIQKYLRHSSMQTTMDTYGTLSIEEMETIADRENIKRIT